MSRQKFDPITQILLEIPTALQDEIITDSGVKFYIDPSYKKEWQAAVTAKIVSLPIKCSAKEKKIIDQLKVGDEVAVSYSIVADFAFQGDGHRFMPATEENPHFQVYYNGKGESIQIYAMQKRSGFTDVPTWVGIYTDKYRNFVDGVQGSEEQVSRWQAQFQFGKTDEYQFNNFFEYDKKDLWRCRIDQVFAKKIKNHLVAVGDRVICKPIDEEVPAEVLQHIQHHESVKIRYQDRGRVITGGKEKGIKKDQVVSFYPNHCEKYTFWGKEYFLIKESFVQGIWN